jgi:phosphoglycerate dehydrogenase-like enzyme
MKAQAMPSLSQNTPFFSCSLWHGSFPLAVANVKQRRFGAPLSTTVQGKTVAILGCRQYRRRNRKAVTSYSGYGLLGIKQHPSDALAGQLGLEFLGGTQDLPGVLAEADFVVLALPVTATTRGVINTARSHE